MFSRLILSSTGACRVGGAVGARTSPHGGPTLTGKRLLLTQSPISFQRAEETKVEDKTSVWEGGQRLGLQTMKGMWQMAFCNDARSGALVVAALALSNPVTAACAVAGCLASTLTARAVVPADDACLGMGLYGFNGALVGAAATVL